ncbi:MAG: L-ribulose-5-phosphate 4-epimerase AraD, partial [archaeon]|nr:L-ribulose-5-phosphate 4-epimerase AraD [archaeon]
MGSELKHLKEIVCKANRRISESGLAKFTWGNASAITDDRKLVVIKPSGVPYKKMLPHDMVVVDLHGKLIGGSLKPSSDCPTHLELYGSFSAIKSVVHTHSTYATAFAQAKKPIPILGTTHADYFRESVPVTRDLKPSEVKHDYELNTGKVIAETFKKKRISYSDVPACLVASHGVFVWGNSCENAVHNAVVLEEIALMAIHTLLLNGKIKSLPLHVGEKHYERKHGKNAYYGQGR